MDTMQQELQESYPLLRIQLAGINERGQEPGNAMATDGIGLPWLQDVDVDADGRSDVFVSWQVALRDVVILDDDNVKVGVYNLNTHDLAHPANYATLRQMLVDAAMASQLPWRNASRPLDVDNNSVIAPLDVLIVINRLNAGGTGPLPPPQGVYSPPPFYDVSGDNQLTALDALQVINHLNSAAGEGESRAAAESPPAGMPLWFPVESTAAAANSGDAPPARREPAGEPAAGRSWQQGVDLVFDAEQSGQLPNPLRADNAIGPREPATGAPGWLLDGSIDSLLNLAGIGLPPTASGEPA